MSGILDKAKKISELDPWVHAAIFGPPGAGKTIFGCTGGRVLLLDADGTGSSSLVNHPELVPNVQVLRIKTQTEAIEVAWELRKNPTAFDTVMVDTISMLQMNDLNALLRQKFNEWSSSKQGAPRNPYVSYQNDYGENTNRMRDVIIQYCDLPLHVIFTMHELREREGDDEMIYIRPAVTPKVANTIHGLVDLTGYLTCDTSPKGDESRKLRVKATRRITAKTRIKFPTPELLEPSFADLLAAKQTLVKMAQDAA